MIIDSLKNILPFTDSKIDSDFKNILKKFPEQYILKSKDIELLYNAYTLGLEAHKGQKENQVKIILHTVSLYQNN